MKHQDMGLSTTRINAVQAMLTDETVHIYKRSLVVEPFPIAIHLCKNSKEGIVKYSVPIEDAGCAVSKFPAPIYQFIFLEKLVMHKEARLIKITPDETIRLLLQNHVDLGCNKDESITTLFYLAKKVPAVKFLYSEYKDLLSHIPFFKENHSYDE